ncbi:MAG: bacteriohemerythrin [Desulforhopalus sp.]|nr:bacteriohemerythrin [Desulforhopalus sp.]
MSWKNISIGGKLAIGFGLMLLFLSIISICSWYGFQSVNERVGESLYLSGVKELALQKEIDHLQWRDTISEIFTNTQKNSLDVQVDDHKCKLGLWLYSEERKDAEKRMSGLAGLLRQLEQPHKEMHDSARALQEAIVKGGGNREVFLPEFSKIFQEKTQPNLGLVRDQLHAVIAEIDKQLGVSKEELQAKIVFQKMFILFVSLGALVLGIVLSVVIGHGITGVLKKAVLFAGNIAKGDLTEKFEVERRDELGVLAVALSTISQNLSKMIGTMSGEVVGLASASNELTSLSHRMCKGATMVSEMSTSVAAATEEMSSNMNSLAAASEEAATNVNIVASAAEEVSSSIAEVAGKTREARGITADAVALAKSSSGKVDALGLAANEISKVTQAITEISDQTNLLALNATIEAARAGEAGKGFAVVAHEIKELAKQTAAATSEIRASIESIQSSTSETVTEIRQIAEVINKVDDIVADIATSVEEQSATTTEISTNVQQAAMGINEVNGNVAQSSTVSSSVAADIAKVSQTAFELAGNGSDVEISARDIEKIADYLKTLSGQFKINSKDLAGVKEQATSTEVVPDLMRWDSSLQLGIGQIDDQHKQLVAMINDLHRAMKRRQTLEIMGGILERLVNYTVYHFGNEEKLFQKHGYPEYEQHKKIHETLVGKVIEFKSKIDRGDSTISMELMDFLKDWLVNHIKGTDKKYVPFLQEKGVK